MESVQLGSIGVEIILTVRDKRTKLPIDISTATVRNIILKNPSNVKTTKAGSFVTNGEDGKIRYTTQLNDLNKAGVWQAQAYVEYGSVKAFGTIVKFKVEANL